MLLDKLGKVTIEQSLLEVLRFFTTNRMGLISVNSLNTNIL